MNTQTASAPQMSLFQAPEAEAPAAEPVIPHYLHCIGESYYSIESFIKEANELGISRRLRSIPQDIVVGKSRIYLTSGAGHDSAPDFCDKCIGFEPCPICLGLGRVENPRYLATAQDEDVIRVTRGRKMGPTVQCKACHGKGTRPADRAKLPNPSDAEILNGKKVVICGRCTAVHEVTPAKGGIIFGYFVPSAIELVLRISDEAAKVVALLFKDMVTVEGGLGEETYRIRGTIDADHPEAAELLKSLGVSADTVQADILGALKASPGASILGVVSEPIRGCGTRKAGGKYIVTSSGEKSLMLIEPKIEYDGCHFRGIVKLEDKDAAELDAHVKGERVVVLKRRDVQEQSEASVA